MCAIPARVAGVERIALASPPGPDGTVNPLVLAAAALCGVDEIYAMGGAQAIFALAYGTETIAPVDVIAGPGNAWVQEAKRAVYGSRRDRLARRPVGADGGRRPRHRSRVGGARPLRPGRARRRQPAGRRRGRGGACSTRSPTRPRRPRPSARASATRRWRWSRSPTSSDAIDLANAFAPEHLELLEEDAALLADAGHDRRLRLRRPLRRHRLRRLRRRLQPRAADRRRRSLLRPARPGAFRRKIATVEVPPRRRRSWRRTSTRSPAPRASPSTASPR